MPTIPLTQGQRARVDWCDYKELSRHKWRAKWNSSTLSFYAARNSSRQDGGQRTVFMHRQILGLERGDGKQVDHKDHNTLDNRRRNMRVCTVRENAENQRNQSLHGVGVWGRKDLLGKPFRVEVQMDGKRHHVGYFATPEEAREARRRFLEAHES